MSKNCKSSHGAVLKIRYATCVDKHGKLKYIKELIESLKKSTIVFLLEKFQLFINNKGIGTHPRFNSGLQLSCLNNKLS